MFKRRIMILWLLILMGFAVIEFPGIFFINRIEPRLFGLPFIYGFSLVVWAYLCLLMFLGYRMEWGRKEETTGREKSPRSAERKERKCE